MSQLRNGREQIIDEWKRLKQQWEATSSQWGDAARYRFEREFWQAYEPIINAYIKQLDNLDNIIDQAKQEVR